MNEMIMQKLIESKYLSRNIEQQYKRVINLDKHQRERVREKRREIEFLVPRVNIPANTGKTQ